MFFHILPSEKGDRLPIKAVIVSRPNGLVTFLYGVDHGGREALINLIESNFDSDVYVTNVNEITSCPQCHMAIFLIGNSPTHNESQRAQKMSNTLMSRDVLVNFIYGRHAENIYSCDSWLHVEGTGGVVDTASSILKSLYSPGLIGFDFEILKSVFSVTGMGKALTAEVTFSSAEGRIRKPKALTDLCNVIGGAKHIIFIVAMNAEGRLIYVDSIANHCRRSISKNAIFTITTVFDEKCSIPKLTVIGLQG